MKVKKIMDKTIGEKRKARWKKTTCHGAQNIRKDTAMNLADNTNSECTLNTLSAAKPVYPFRKKRAKNKFKRKKERSNNEGFVNNSTPWLDLKQEANGKINQSNLMYNSEEKTDDNSIPIATVEKRNLGSPLVIDVLSDGITSINLPQIFEQEQRTGSNEETFYNDVFDVNEFLSENARTTVAESANSQYKTDIQIKHIKHASPVPSSVAKNDENTDASNDGLRDVNVNINTPIRSHKRKDFVKSQNSRPVELNSDGEAYGNLSHENPAVNWRQPTCNWKPLKFYCIRNVVIVVMESGKRLCFTGKLLVKVLYGAVKIYGSVLAKSSGTTEVYSPRGYSNVTIETSEEFPEGSVDDVWTALASEGVTRDSESELQTEVDNVCPGAAVLVLQNLENELTLFLKIHFPYFKLFPKVKNPHYFSWTDPRRAELILQAHLRLQQYDNVNYQRLIIDPCITTDIAERMLSRWRANEWSCTLIAGGQNVGKSTSARCLINSLLRTSGKVVLVDVDPGQAECTPPGCISYSLIEEPLMGPNFTHLKAPVYQLFIDEVNVSRCLTRYLEGIKMLIERLKECPVLSRLPIVVNTMGFTKGLGWDIMIFTIKLIGPSIILQIISSKKKNNYDNFLSAEVVNKQECSFTFCDEKFIDWNRPCEHDLCMIYSQAETAAQNKLNLEPYQKRELMMMSYFSGMMRDENDSPQTNMRPTFSINKVVPYTAPFSSLCIIPQQLFGVPASQALSVINGNIVALCGIDLMGESSQESENISGSLQVLTQRSPLCTCYGFGIVRGVDMERQEMYINTPLPISILQYANCLAGCMPVPPALLQFHQGAPYVGRDGEAELPTSREPRRGYSRMRYQNKPNKL